MIASFLNPMLRLHPDRRAKAADMAHHVWLDAMVVKGEIEALQVIQNLNVANQEVNGGENLLPVAADAADTSVTEEDSATTATGGSSSKKKKKKTKSPGVHPAQALRIDSSSNDAMKPISPTSEVDAPKTPGGAARPAPLSPTAPRALQGTTPVLSAPPTASELKKDPSMSPSQPRVNRSTSQRNDQLPPTAPPLSVTQA